MKPFGFCGSRPMADRKSRRHEDGRPQHEVAEGARPVRHAGIGQQQPDDQAERDEDAGVGVAGAEEGLLQVVGGEAAGEDAQQEGAAEGDGQVDEDDDAGAEQGGLLHE